MLTTMTTTATTTVVASILDVSVYYNKFEKNFFFQRVGHLSLLMTLPTSRIHPVLFQMVIKISIGLMVNI